MVAAGRLSAEGPVRLSRELGTARFGAAPAGPSRALVDSAGIRPNPLGLWGRDRAALVGEVRAWDAGRVLAFGRAARVEVWRSGVPASRLGSIELPADDAPTALAVSPDGRALAVETTLGRVLLLAVDVDPMGPG